MKNGNAALSSTLHTGGIRAMLDNAHAGLGGTRGLSDEVKAYITSHFQMIKSENENLRRSLDKRSRQLDRMHSEHMDCEARSKRLSEVEKKLDRERMRAKMMARRIKEEDDGDPDIQWMGVPQVDKHNLRPSRSTESLDSTSRVAAAERKEKDVRKQLNDAKGEVLQLRAALLREVGSEAGLQAALNNSGDSSSRISDLEDSGKLKNPPPLPRPPTSPDKVLEVERERLSEYVRVLSKRLAAAEEKSSEAEFGLRDERRKTAKLERMLEQAHVEMRNSVPGTPARNSVPGTPARVMRDQRDEIDALSQELREFKRDIDGLRARRNEDLEFFLNNNNNRNKKGNGGGNKGKKRSIKTPSSIDMRPEWRSE